MPGAVPGPASPFRGESLFRLLDNIRSRPDAERILLNTMMAKGACTLRQLVRETKQPEELVRSTLAALLAERRLTARGMPNNPLFGIEQEGRMGGDPRRYAGGPVIPPVYQFNLLCDAPRVKGFRDAIKRQVNPGDLVVELGGGSGILSIFAAQAGARVVYVEVDPEVAILAETFIKDLGLESKIVIELCDATEFECFPRADVVICEMLDTAMIDELQVAVMNHAIKHVLKPGGIAIPGGATTSAQLAAVDFRVAGMDFPLPHFDTPTTNRIVARLSRRTDFHTADFRQQNALDVNAESDILATEDGVVNAVVIGTTLALGQDIVLEGTPWLNPDLVLPVTPTTVRAGTNYPLNISYRMGSSFSGLQYSFGGGPP